MTARFLSPTQIAVRAAGLSMVGQPAQQDGVCALCGYVHHVGDIVSPFSAGDSFTDFGALRAKHSKTVCGSCLATWSADFTQRYSKAVICAQGVFPAASNDHIAWWLLNPPSGAWVMVQSDQKRQHVLWRAPVNTSTEVFVVRFGEIQLTIRRKYLQAGADAAERLAAVASEGRKGAPLKSPFAALSRDLDIPSHGTLRHGLYAMAGNPQIKADIDLINGLTPGELWGLTAVLYAQNPTRPNPKLTPLGPFVGP